MESVDNRLDHLYPEFRAKLLVVLTETSNALGAEWEVVEGFRSQARQDWLYARGRTRPGPVVTWQKMTRWHGAGLAADCVPKVLGYHAPRSDFEMFRHVYQSHGLENPAWVKGDLGHVQLTDETIRTQALAWIRGGFI